MVFNIELLIGQVGFRSRRVLNMQHRQVIHICKDMWGEITGR